jgi:hypothetical protein
MTEKDYNCNILTNTVIQEAKFKAIWEYYTRVVAGLADGLPKHTHITNMAIEYNN